MPRPRLPLALLALAAAAFAAGPDAGAAPGARAAVVEAAVARVIDGDTLRLDGRAASLRIWGLDAPEQAARGGPAATAAMRELAAGARLVCRLHGTDRFGRDVGECRLPDGRDLAAAMIAAGAAREFCRFSGNRYRTC